MAREQIGVPDHVYYDLCKFVNSGGMANLTENHLPCYIFSSSKEAFWFLPHIQLQLPCCLFPPIQIQFLYPPFYIATRVNLISQLPELSTMEAHYKNTNMDMHQVTTLRILEPKQPGLVCLSQVSQLVSYYTLSTFSFYSFFFCLKSYIYR